MALPKQVERQLKELEALEKKLAANEKSNEESATEAEPALEPTNEAEADPKQEQQSESSPPTADAKLENPDEGTDWKQKYKTLQGMYDAEVPRLHGQVKELTGNLAKLEATIAKQQDEQKVLAEKAQKAEAVARLVTDDDVETFGEDLIEVQRKVAREVTAEFKAELDALKSENAKLRESVDSVGTKAAEASFEQNLHRLVPDFDSINASKEWIDWLNEVDPILRGPRMSVAQDAYARGDAEAVAHYVHLYKAGKPVAPAKVDPAKDVERQIQPDRSAGGAKQSANSGHIYSNAEIQGMFNKAIKLSNSGRIDEAHKLEAEIDAAYQSGRVNG